MNAPINFNEMASRDPALAALMGAIPGYDFGYSAPSRAPAPALASLPALSGVGFGGSLKRLRPREAVAPGHPLTGLLLAEYHRIEDGPRRALQRDRPSPMLPEIGQRQPDFQ